VPRGCDDIVIQLSAQGGEIAGGQNRSPREKLVLDALIMSDRVVPADDGAFHDVVGIVLKTPTLLHTLADHVLTGPTR
jgi:hypothetical protein